MSGTYSNAPCTEEGYKTFYYTSNSWGFFSEYTILVYKNPNSGYEGGGIFYF
jgi:hypothetical protein